MALWGKKREMELKNRAFKLFDEKKLPTTVAGELHSPIDKVNKWFDEYDNALMEHERRILERRDREKDNEQKKRAIDNKFKRVNKTDYAQPFHVTKLVKNDTNGRKDRQITYPMAFDTIPDSFYDFTSFCDENGDGVYTLLDNRGVKIKDYVVTNRGFSDPSELEAKRGGHGKGRGGPSSVDDEAEAMVALEVRKFDVAWRVAELFAELGNPAAAERMMNRIERMELGGVEEKKGGLFEQLKEFKDLGDGVGALAGMMGYQKAGESGEDKTTQLVGVIGALLEKGGKEIVQPLVQNFGMGPKKGTVRFLRDVESSQQRPRLPQSNGSLPQLPAGAQLQGEYTPPPKRTGVEPPADGAREITEQDDDDMENVRSIEDLDGEARLVINNVVPQLIEGMVKNISTRAVAKPQVELLIQLRRMGRVPDEKLEEMLAFARGGAEAYIREYRPLIESGIKRYSKAWGIFKEGGMAGLKKLGWRAPPGTKEKDVEETLTLYGLMKTFWDLIQAPEHLDWLKEYQQVMVNTLERMLGKPQKKIPKSKVRDPSIDEIPDSSTTSDERDNGSASDVSPTPSNHKPPNGEGEGIFAGQFLCFECEPNVVFSTKKELNAHVADEHGAPPTVEVIE